MRSDFFSAFDRCYGADAPVLLAVSGGSDSMALMHASAAWALECGAPAPFVATVDHGLRVGSAEDACFVVSQAAALRLECTVLQWRGEKPTTGIQAKARAVRYDLLVQHACMCGCKQIAVAHTRDDQVETVLMRLAHGSGLNGLSGMAVRAPLAEGVELVRPMLDVSKEVLSSFLQERGLIWREDPSNNNEAFERVRWRQGRALLEDMGLSDERVLRFATRARHSAEALDFVVERLWPELSLRHEDGRIFVDAAFLGWPQALQIEVLQRLIALFPDAGAVRLERLERLQNRLQAAHFEGCYVVATLAGLVFKLGRLGLMIQRQPARQI